MEAPQDQYIDVQSLGHNIKTRYWQLGSGEPVLLVHGLGGYIENWENNIHALAENFNVTALDVVGFGRSAKPEIKPTVKALAQFVADAMQSLNIESAQVIGHSLGGMISLQLALSHPERVRSLLLVSSGGFGKDISATFKLLSIPVLGKLLLKPSKAKIEQGLKVAFYDDNFITAERVERGFNMASIPGVVDAVYKTNRTNTGLGGIRPTTIDPILNHLQDIRVPVMTLWGRQDKAVPIEHEQVASQKLPQHQSHIFDNCGHWPQIEHAEQFNRIVLEFLSSES